MGVARKFQKSDVPRSRGERARLKVIQGREVGAVYILTGDSVSIGRGEENDVVLMDLKASRNHAQLMASESGTWAIKDLGSSNGILIRGRPLREGFLRTGDVITIGETVLEFFTTEVGTSLLMAPPKSADRLNTERAQLEAQKAKVRALGGLQGPAAPPSEPLSRGSPFSPSAGQPSSSSATPQNPVRLMLYLVVGAVGIWTFMGDPPADPKKKDKDGKDAVSKDEERNMAEYLPQLDNMEIQRTNEQFFREGFREYREGNYLRAKQSFETVLQMSPAHPMARLYLNKSNQEIETAVTSYLSIAAKQIESGKLKQAKGNLQAVKRLLYRDQSNPAYITAEEELKKVEKLLK